MGLMLTLPSLIAACMTPLIKKRIEPFPTMDKERSTLTKDGLKDAAAVKGGDDQETGPETDRSMVLLGSQEQSAFDTFGTDVPHHMQAVLCCAQDDESMDGRSRSQNPVELELTNFDFANPTFEDEPSNNASSASSAPGLFEDGGLASEFMVAVGLEDEDEWDEAPAKGKDRYAAVMASYDAEGGSSVSTLAAPSGRALAAPSGRELGI